MDDDQYMSLKDQYYFLEDLANEFMSRDRIFKEFPAYDGHYAELAGKLERVQSSIYRLEQLE